MVLNRLGKVKYWLFSYHENEASSDECTERSEIKHRTEHIRKSNKNLRTSYFIVLWPLLSREDLCGILNFFS